MKNFLYSKAEVCHEWLVVEKYLRIQPFSVQKKIPCPIVKAIIKTTKGIELLQIKLIEEKKKRNKENNKTKQKKIGFG
jgi:hypothetical protein